MSQAPKVKATDTKMPQCPKHRGFYPFDGKCFACVVESFEAEDRSGA